MLLLLLLLVVLVGGTMCMVAYRCWLEDESGAEHGARTSGAEQPPGQVSATQPDTPEGVLAAQLVAGEITRHQYSRAMERLAARRC